MRHGRKLIPIVACSLVMALPSVLFAADEALCYAAADGPDRLVSSWRLGGGFVDIGAFGVGGIEAITFNLDNSVLYGTNGGTLGSINTTTGAFSAIGAAGAGDGALGTITMTDLDGLAFDPTNGYLYAAEREAGDDLLIRLDPATGALVPDAFGPGVDYVVVLASPITGFDDIDDLAIDPTDGQMYAISNDGGTDDRLVKVDKTDGSVIDVGAFIGTDDMEGLSVSPDGELFGTTGNGGGNSLWNIDKLTGFATFVFAYPGGITDIEGVSCLRQNIITGTVFVDSDSDGVLDPTELGLSGVTVRLYRDNNNDGAVDAGDTLIQTTVSPADGFYEFFITSTGNFVLDIDTTDLPSGWSLTTDNVEEADFTNYGNVESGNDFGAIGVAGDISISKVASTSSACPGDVITYTMTLTNNGALTHTGITVGDALLSGATYVPQSTAATGVAPISTFRVTEYFIDPGVFGGAGYNLTLDQDLSSDYFVIIQGSAGTGGSGDDRGPDDNYARLTDDPFGTGDLGTSTGNNVIRLERDSGTDSWVGVVTVVECLADCAAGGFTLLGVEDVTAPDGSSSGTDTSASSWTDINQVMLMGGFNGAGCFTPDTTDTDTPVCHKRIWPSGSNTINWSRNTADGNDNWATSTVMVVEWGSEWTVQRVNVAADPANSGNGVDSTGEYETASITSVARDNTWVWGTGWTDDNGPGDSAEGVVITLGDGVNQNANETSVAVGLEHNNRAIDFEVYTLTHSDLAVDYRFKTDGDSGTLGVNVAVDSAGAERMALSYNGNSDTGDNHPRSMFSARYLNDASVRLERRRSGSNFPAWVQGIDYSGIGSGTTTVTKDNASGGLNPDLADGVPPNLVTAADAFQIPPGQSMTVTFRAIVDNPYNGASQLVNIASGRSAEGGFDLDSAGTFITLSSIGNLVWHDFHPNNMQDASEPGIPDVPITLYGPGADGNLGTADDVYVSSTFTDANGNYSFPNIGPGDYRVDINEAWLTANGYPIRRYPAAAGYWDLPPDLPALTCGATQAAADFGYWDGTTVPVTLSSFEASDSRSGTVIEWSTATQLGTVGFNLYAVTGGGWSRLNTELIPAHTPDSTTPQHYRFEIADVEAEGFAIEDVDILGHRKRHGPFSRNLRHGLDARVSPEKPVDWSAVREEHFHKVEARRLARLEQARENSFPFTKGATEVALRGSSDRKAPWGEIAELLVDESGLYRVTYEDMLRKGIDLAGLNADELALKTGGQAVPVFVRGGPVFGPGSWIEWVAEGLATIYTTTNVYVMSLEPRYAQRVHVDWRGPNPAAVPAEYYLETVTAERNRKYSFSSPNGDPWYDTAILAFTSPKHAAFDIEIDGLVEDAEMPSVRVDMWGTTDWPDSPDHHVEVSFNGVPLADEFFDGLVNYPLDIDLPYGVLENGTNTLELNLPGDTGVAYDMVTFDRFSVTYPRRFEARQGRLDFVAAAEQFQVDGLSGSKAVVYRIDGDEATLLAGADVTLGESGYSATFPGSYSPARYLVTTGSAVRKPRIEPVRETASITTGRASYLVISHPDFIDGLDSLVAAREAEGWTVKVVDVEDVYAGFSYGVVDPEALRSYISWAAENLETEMVLLVGGDTYDYHDHLGLGSVSFVPSLYTATGEIVRFAPADPLLTDIDGDNLPDLPIGRLPVRTSTELERVIDKILDYADKSYPRTGVFAADDDESSGESFAAISNTFIARLPAGWSVDRAYIGGTSLTHSRAVLRQAINRGVALTSYFGHSGPTVWSFDNLFHASDAALLENHRAPTVVTQWGCWNNYYVEPTNNTIGHALLLSGDQGAAAVLGASTLTLSDSDQALGELFLPRLVEPGMTIGEALQEAKRDLVSSEPWRLDVILGWTLLGDPALVVDPW
jgi:uncharacterized repeat protein (TIGR01451 family)